MFHGLDDSALRRVKAGCLVNVKDMQKIADGIHMRLEKTENGWGLISNLQHTGKADQSHGKSDR
jgi:hypothetical protein